MLLLFKIYWKKVMIDLICKNGPSENPNTHSLGALFNRQGMNDDAIAHRFLQINNQAPAFNQAGAYFKGIKIVKA